MAATARPPLTLDRSAPDDMDLHSDSGLDFGDGDIDLDLDPAPSAHRQDDDVLIDDAASASGLDVQTAPADQDDFMADNEDFIEEDYPYQANEAAMTIGEPSIGFTATAHAQTLSLPEEDLLEYSDDEEEAEQLTTGQALPSEQEPPKTIPAHQDIPQAFAQPTRHTSGEAFKQPELHSPHQDQVDPNANTEEVANVQGRANSHDSHQSEVHSEEHDQADGEDGGVRLQDDGSFADDDEHEHSDHDISHNDHDHAATTADSEHQHHQSSNLQPVTVNYAGNELWFFKQHDTEETGDWLLEDISLASSSMSDLFQACRASLGDDVSNEHEIGLRFDHLHNLELYEDNTACVAVSLQRLVGLYHTLQEQDDNKEPEFFYCSLLFRPRFATLLSDIAKYAEQGSGYSGLDAAVAAGETHFSNVISGASTEHEQTDWDEEEQEEVGFDNKGLAEYDAQQDIDQSEHEGQDEREAHTEYEEEQDQEGDDGQDHDDASHASVPYEAQVPSTSIDHASHEYASASDVSPSQQGLVGQLDTETSHPHSKEDAEAEARREQQEADLLEYSDDEDPEGAEEVQHTEPNGPSASSSTVQGDETAAVEDGANTATYPAHDDQSGELDNETDFHAENESDNQFNDQLLEGIDDTAQSYQNYGQTFDHDDPFQGFPADNDANQNYTGFEYQALDQQLQLDFLEGAEFSTVPDSTAPINDFAGTDDFLDLNNTSDWVTDQNLTSNLTEDAILPLDQATTQDDQEDGAVEQPAAAVSSAADPDTTSSTEVKNVSPQGQKRSVDEAGHGMDNALDSIDAKRPRV